MSSLLSFLHFFSFFFFFSFFQWVSSRSPTVSFLFSSPATSCFVVLFPSLPLFVDLSVRRTFSFASPETVAVLPSRSPRSTIRRRANRAIVSFAPSSLRPKKKRGKRQRGLVFYNSRASLAIGPSKNNPSIAIGQLKIAASRDWSD